MLEDRLDLRRQGLADAQRVGRGCIRDADAQARREVCERNRRRGARGPRTGDQHIEVKLPLFPLSRVSGNRAWPVPAAEWKHVHIQLAFTAYHEATTPAGLIGGGLPFGALPECGMVRTIEPTIAGTCCTPFGQAGTSQPS